MFAVLGITGNVGGAVAKTLLQHGKKVPGVVRDESKAQSWKEKGVELVKADYDEDLIPAFSGVDGVFAMIPPNLTPDPGFPDSVARIAAIKKAILAAKPPRAVFLSSIGSEKTSGLGLITTTHVLERELGSTSVPSAFLRAGSFMENILHSIPAARASGHYYAFYQPLDHPFPLIATDDIGRIGAEILLQTWKGNRVIELSGPAYYSSNDVAAALEKALGSRSPELPFHAKYGFRASLRTVYPLISPAPTLKCSIIWISGWIDFGVPNAGQVCKGTYRPPPLM